MSSYNNIEKIKYKKSTSEVVNLKEYIVFENERNEIKHIVFKFVNNVNQQLLGMEFEVSQYNIDNELIETSIVICDQFLAKANEEFVPNSKLKVNYNCKTISVKLLKAAFDRFLWNNGEYEDNIYKFEHYYRDEQSQKPAPSPEKQIKKEEGDTKKNITGKKFELKNQTKKNIARFPAVFLAFVFIIVTAFVGGSLYFFRERSDRFTIDSFKLRIIDGNDVSIYGYVGDKEELEIPYKVGNYRIVKIESGAFTDCNIKSVYINTSLTIEKHAFVNCKKLSLIYSTEYIWILCAPQDMFKGRTPDIVMYNAQYIYD